MHISSFLLIITCCLLTSYWLTLSVLIGCLFISLIMGVLSVFIPIIQMKQLLSIYNVKKIIFTLKDISSFNILDIFAILIFIKFSVILTRIHFKIKTKLIFPINLLMKLSDPKKYNIIRTRISLYILLHKLSLMLTQSRRRLKC